MLGILVLGILVLDDGGTHALTGLPSHLKLSQVLGNEDFGQRSRAALSLLAQIVRPRFAALQFLLGRDHKRSAAAPRSRCRPPTPQRYRDKTRVNRLISGRRSESALTYRNSGRLKGAYSPLSIVSGFGKTALSVAGLTTGTAFSLSWFSS